MKKRKKICTDKVHKVGIQQLGQTLLRLPVGIGKGIEEHVRNGLDFGVLDNRPDLPQRLARRFLSWWARM